MNEASIYASFATRATELGISHLFGMRDQDIIPVCGLLEEFLCLGLEIPLIKWS